MSEYYILNEDHSVTPVDLQTWANWFNDKSKRRVASTHLTNGVWVSTVFLGLDHSFGAGGPPILFETMAFEDDSMDATYFNPAYTDRYATWDEAIAGHRAAVTEMMERYPTADVIHEGEPTALVKRKRKLAL